MIHTGDCIEVMAGMPADSVDAVVTDPPYGLEFMGRSWDRLGDVGTTSHSGPAAIAGGERGQYGKVSYSGSANKKCRTCGKWAWDHEGRKCECEVPDFPNVGAHQGKLMQDWHYNWAVEALRVTKPGGYLLAFGGTRTHHRLVCGLEDAGWIIRDELDWIYACLSDDTELLTQEHGWVRYNSANEGDHAAAFDTDTGELRWERIEAVHQYDHDGLMVEVGPSLVTLNHRVIFDAETARVPHLPRLWDELPSGVGMGEADGRAVMLAEVQRDATYPRSPVPSGQGVERGAAATAAREDDGLRESGLEGRRYRVQEAWELFGGAIRPSPGVGAVDGPQGRIHHGAPPPDGLYLRLHNDKKRSGQSREPRPDRQPSRELDDVAGQPDPQAVRMGQGDRGDGLPPGDTPRLVGYAGVVWCITVPSGAFVARRNGIAFVTGNSGFPKGKANLKPAHEPIVLARKPGPLRPLGIDECRIEYAGPADFEATVSEQSGPRSWKRVKTESTSIDLPPTGGVSANLSGRWPSNLLLSDPELFDEPNPYVVGSGATTSSNDPGVTHTMADGWGMPAERRNSGYDDSGGYSRFFRIPTRANNDGRQAPGTDTSGGGSGRAGESRGGGATQADSGGTGSPTEGATASSDGRDYPSAFLIPKADRSDREPIVRGQLEGQIKASYSGGVSGTSPRDDNFRSKDARENLHPTVKPTDLMRHLVRLVTPSGGTVLDCFAGSGSTLIAAEMEGFAWIGIEQDASYVAIAEARLNGTQRGLGLDVPAPTRKQATGGSMEEIRARGGKHAVNDPADRSTKSQLYSGLGDKEPAA